MEPMEFSVCAVRPQIGHVQEPQADCKVLALCLHFYV